MKLESMFTKKQSFVYVLFACLFTVSFCQSFTEIYSDEDITELENFFDPGHIWSDEDEAIYIDMLSKTCTIEPESVVSLLTTPPILLQDLLLNQNLYKRTNPLNTRPLQDLPALHFIALNYCFGENEFGVSLFYNQMRKAFLSKCSSDITSYLALGDASFIQKLDELVRSLQQSKFDAPLILSLFNNIQLEERRVGGLFEYQRRSGCIDWRFQIPLYYIEHNFYLTPQEQRAIADEPLFQTTGEPVDDFIHMHIVNDLLGVGDLRFQARWHIKETDSVFLALSAEFTFPTSIIFKNGLVGSKFQKKPEQPNLDIYSLVCTAEENSASAIDELIEFGTDALDRIARIAGATTLGGEHVGVGPVLETRFWANHSLNWYNKFRLHYLLPSTAIRFFRVTKNANDFDRDYDNADLATENLDFLSEQLVNTLFPPAVFTRVSPGTIIEFTTAAHFDCNHIHAELGYDFWYQGAEMISLADPRNTPTQYDQTIGEKFSAKQHKVFGKVFWDKIWRCRDWRIGLTGDLTFSSVGIGKDWTLGIDIALRY